MKKMMIFPKADEFTKAKNRLVQLALPHTVEEPPCGSGFVPAILLSQEAYEDLSRNMKNEFVFAGCVSHQEGTVLHETAKGDEWENTFPKVYIMHAAQCTADDCKIRITAHLEADIGHIFPYLNAQMKAANYTPDAQTFTFMDAHRLVTLYNNKIAISKADNIFDVWRMLIKIAEMVSLTERNKANISPVYETKIKPPAMSILKLLPGISCKECGHKTCMAFSLALWGGTANPMQCKPIFEGDYQHLQQAYLELCMPFL